MTRFIWDKFSKDFIETLLSPLILAASSDQTQEDRELIMRLAPLYQKLEKPERDKEYPTLSKLVG